MLDAILQVITLILSLLLVGLGYLIMVALCLIVLIGFVFIACLTVGFLYFNIVRAFAGQKTSDTFKNPKPVTIPEDARQTDHYNVQKLDLASFPTVADFRIQAEATKGFGHQLHFESDAVRYLGSFARPFVERRLERYQWDDIPVGDMEYPFDDGEQWQQILIFENANYVHILFGDEIGCTEFPIWFKVKKDRYYDEWSRIISEFNPDFRPPPARSRC